MRISKNEELMKIEYAMFDVPIEIDVDLLRCSFSMLVMIVFIEKEYAICHVNLNIY